MLRIYYGKQNNVIINTLPMEGRPLLRLLRYMKRRYLFQFGL